ncbi:MAG: type II toxin-antitoxin system RelE/ParE family toxin [Blastocatellia bacterium]
MIACEFHPAAKQEFEDAAAYYDSCGLGLGDKFVTAIKETINRIEKFPGVWPLLSNATRRCRTPRFPYGVVYQVEPQRILILAVMHLHRRPGYWVDRI